MFIRHKKNNKICAFSKCTKESVIDIVIRDEVADYMGNYHSNIIGVCWEHYQICKDPAQQKNLPQYWDGWKIEGD